ncbi:glycosyltransferase [Succinimonas amylolytica]|uniref:glycosyltransferase n=1 Tax=Succinimonas amylolytica TaxID=83769 RepID=UPI000370ED51|nr:glycosyltransferase [Succinimonas amylolytica]
MTKETVIELLNKYKENSELKGYISKIFLHKDELPVIEFTSRNRTFAFDAKIKGTEIELKLIWRKNSKKFGNFISFNKTVSEKEISAVINTVAYQALDLIEKNGNILVSVVVPVCNSNYAIPRLIDSLKTQSIDKSSFEVIFIEDYSTDNAVKKIKLCANGLNFKVISTFSNSESPSLSRNIGIKTAVGDYLLFANIDDYLNKDTLKEAIECALENGNDIIYLKYESTDPETRVPTRIWNGSDIKSKADIFKNSLISSLSPYKLFSTHFLRSNNLYFKLELNNMAEQLFMIECLSKSKNVAVLKNRTYYYLTTEQNLKNQYKIKETDDTIYKLWSESIMSVLQMDNYNKKSKLFNSLYYSFATKYHSVIRENKKQKLINQLAKIIILFENFSSLFDESLIFRRGLNNVVFMRNYSLETIQTDYDNSKKVKKIATKLIPKEEVINNRNVMTFNDSGELNLIDSIPNLEVKFLGKSGLVKIHESVNIKGKCIFTLGNQSAVVINKNTVIDSIEVVLKAKSCNLWIGNNTTIIKTTFASNYQNNSEIIIDKNCYINKGTKFIASVPYSICEKVSNNIVNAENFGIHLGESVYIENDTTITENVQIPSNCLVKIKSVVNTSKIVSGSILSGNPARTIATGIYWKKESPQNICNKIF